MRAAPFGAVARELFPASQVVETEWFGLRQVGGPKTKKTDNRSCVPHGDGIDQFGKQSRGTDNFRRIRSAAERSGDSERCHCSAGMKILVFLEFALVEG